MSDKPPRSRLRRVLRWSAALFVLVLVLYLVHALLTTPVRKYTARRWAQELAGIANPGSASPGEPAGLYRHVFGNGEWLVGRSENSHGLTLFGGVTVVRDSRGDVRCFLGHVCGPNALRTTCRRVSTGGEDSLEGFYAIMAEGDEGEYLPEGVPKGR